MFDRNLQNSLLEISVPLPGYCTSLISDGSWGVTRLEFNWVRRDLITFLHCNWRSTSRTSLSSQCNRCPPIWVPVKNNWRRRATAREFYAGHRSEQRETVWSSLTRNSEKKAVRLAIDFMKSWNPEYLLNVLNLQNRFCYFSCPTLFYVRVIVGCSW